jgi:hypothetical protein
MNINSPCITAIVCAVALTACGKRHDEKAIEKAIEQSSGGKASVDISKGKFEIKTAEGEFKMSSGEGVQIPADFPKDVYVHEGAKATAAMTLPKGHMLTLETADAVAKVAGAYQSKMEAQGWKQEMAMDNGGTKMFVYKKDKLTAQVTIAGEGDGGKTTISVTAVAGE